MTGGARQDDAPNGGGAGRFCRLALKELRETLRDRRTIATLIVMPLLVYPLLSLTFQKFLLTNVRSAGRPQFRFGVETDEAGHILIAFLERGNKLLQEAEKKNANEAPQKPATEGGAGPAAGAGTTAEGSLGPENVRTEIVLAEKLDEAVANLDVSLGVRIKKLEQRGPGTVPDIAIDCDLLYVEQSQTGAAALDYLQTRMRAVNDAYVRATLSKLNPAAQVRPAEFAVQSVLGEGAPAAYSLSALIPLILILMTITGAVYPAIDLTAGERERGTLEMLIAAPVPRMGLLLAKYAAVLLVAVLTASVNLVSMGVTVWAIGLGPVLFGESGLSLAIVAEVFGLMILFAAFFSAVLLAVTSFARSFKEAQAYLIPLMLVSIAPGLLSMIPGVKLKGLLTVAPLVNIVLLARDLFEHAAEPLSALVVIASTVLFALAAITLAGRIFGTDAILYGSPESWSDLFRRPRELRPAPTLTSAMLLLALMFPVYFVVSNLLARLQHARLEVRLGWMSVVTALLFAAMPLLVAAVGRVRLREGFRLKTAPLLAFGGALVLGLSLWPLAYEMVLLASNAGIASFGDDAAERIRGLVAQFRTVSPVWIVLTLAVVPAVCEELFFRGYLLGALVARMSRARAVAASGVVFGLFHMLVTDALAVERLLPSTLLGMVLAWVCLKSGSIVPGMLLHAMHNAFLLLVSYYGDRLAAAGWGVQEESHLPLLWLAGSVIASAIGFALLSIGTRGLATEKRD